MGNNCSSGTLPSSAQDPADHHHHPSNGAVRILPPNAPAPPKPKHHTPPTTTSASSTSPIGRVLGRPMEDVRSTYTFGRELGRGQFGVTYLVTDKQTKQLFACKSIATRKLTNQDDVEDVRREVQIMHHLTGHRNIVELKGPYEDRHSVNLVMELCAGGELFDRIIAKGHYSERAAANLCRQIVTVVHYCHSMRVMHRQIVTVVQSLLIWYFVELCGFAQLGCFRFFLFMDIFRYCFCMIRFGFCVLRCLIQKGCSFTCDAVWVCWNV